MTKRKNLEVLKKELALKFQDFVSSLLAANNEEELAAVLVEALASVRNGNIRIYQISKQETETSG